MLILSEEEILAEKPQEVLTDVTSRAERAAICNGCEEKGTHLGVDICNKCKCILPFKTLIKLSQCPLNKWVVDESLLPKAD